MAQPAGQGISATAWLYIMFNIASSLSIVFANKAVFAVYHFPYPFLLTLIHIAFTAVGMQIMASVRLTSYLGCWAFSPLQSIAFAIATPCRTLSQQMRRLLPAWNALPPVFN